MGESYEGYRNRLSAFADALVEVWQTFPPGTRVRVLRDNGSVIETVTRSVPWLLGDGHPMILLEGQRGGYALERVRPISSNE